jgi:hypothetical protein
MSTPTCDQRCIPIDRGNAREVSHPSARRSLPGLRGFGDDGHPDYADQDYTHNTHGVIAAIAHKHTKVTPESPGGSGIPA